MSIIKNIFKVRVVTSSLFPAMLGVDAITIYPFIFIAVEKPDDILLNHEFLHIKQVEMLGWFSFYLSYLMYYWAGRLSGLDHDEAYMDIPYERVAYEQESNMTLVQERVGRGIV
jgi:hypothetical protein